MNQNKIEKVFEIITNADNDDYLTILFDYLNMGDYLYEKVGEFTAGAEEETLDVIIRDFGAEED